MVRKQPDGPEATCDGPEATLMVRRQQIFVPCYGDGPEATCDQAGRTPKASEKRGKMSQNFVRALY